MKTETPKQHATTRHKSEIPNPVHPVNPVQKSTASAPKRRMRRRACTKSEISNHKSEIIPVPNPVHPVNPVQKKSSSVRAHPFQPLPEFAHLRPDQLDYI